MKLFECDLNIKTLEQIGPKRSYIFNKLGIFTIKDLLFYFPIKYLSLAKKIKEEEILFEAKVIKKIKINVKIYKIYVDFKSNLIEITLYNQKLYNVFFIDNLYYFYGKIYKQNDIFKLDSPKIFNQKCKKFACYKGLSSYFTHELIMSILNNLDVKNKVYKDKTIKDILINIHQGTNLKESKEALKYLEACYFVQNFKEEISDQDLVVNFGEIENKIGYKLTKEQFNIVKKIEQKLSCKVLMKYLVYGEVSSGKTLICIASILMVIKQGYTVAFIAPTVSLAFQHYTEINKILNENVILYTSLTPKKKFEKEKIKNGHYKVIISTHAFIYIEDIPNVGLIIIDEMHKFGVCQRSSMFKNAKIKNLLMLTATPIPRTLSIVLNKLMDYDALSSYNKKNTKTIWLNEKKIPFLLEKIKGKKCFWILPSIEDTKEKIGLKSRFENLSLQLKNIILLHGKMKDIEKIDAIEKFRCLTEGILLATTIVEIGINIPNSDIIIIENANQFGLSQLHQLRGRVGRNGQKSYCILISKFLTKKIDYMKKYDNGFDISSKDLELRKSGKITGILQHGCEAFNFLTDADEALIEEVKKNPKIFEEFQLFEKLNINC